MKTKTAERGYLTQFFSRSTFSKMYSYPQFSLIIDPAVSLPDTMCEFCSDEQEADFIPEWHDVLSAEHKDRCGPNMRDSAKQL